MKTKRREMSLLMLLVWFSIHLAAPISLMSEQSKDCDNTCSIDNPICTCNSDEMMDDCPAMRPDVHPFLLILPSAPLAHFNADDDLKISLSTIIDFNPLSLDSDKQDLSSISPSHSPPGQVHTKQYIIFDTFLI